jgi:hypothetical protein
MGEQGAADGDALLRRRRGGPAACPEMADAQQIDDSAIRRRPSRAVRVGGREQVLRTPQMRKQPVLLEYIAEAATPGGTLVPIALSNRTVSSMTMRPCRGASGPPAC